MSDPRKLVLLLTSSMTVMAGATIAPALPVMKRAFDHVENAETITKFVLTIPGLFIALSSPLIGWVVDKFGRKQVLIYGLLLYAAAGSTGLFLNDLTHIIGGRAILGIAVAGIMTVSVTLVGDYYQGLERSQFVGTQAAFMAFGGVVFITVGGLLANLSWRSPFWLYLTSLLLVPIVMRFINEPNATESGLSDQENQANEYKRTLVWLVYGMAFWGLVVFYMVPAQIPFLLSDQMGVSTVLSGTSIAITTGCGAITSLNYSRIRNLLRISYPGIYALSFLLNGIGYMVIGLASSYPAVVVGLMLGGFGSGLIMPNSNLWMIELAPSSLRGRLVGRLTTAVFLGQFASPLLIEPLRSLTSIQFSFRFMSLILGVFALGFWIFRQIRNARRLR